MQEGKAGCGAIKTLQSGSVKNCNVCTVNPYNITGNSKHLLEKFIKY